MLRIFLSHTTRDERDKALAHKLKDGLQKSGIDVWIAPDSIPAGDNWQEHIVSGLVEQCSHFVVIISEASVRAHWVLEEMRLAFQRQKFDPSFKILPLVTGLISDFAYSAELQALQKIPYHPEFQTQLHAVIQAVGARPQMPDYSYELIREKTRDFVGREYIFIAIEEFMAQKSKGYFLIQGDPGAGKSAILAEYVRRTNAIAHFNIASQRINTANQFLQNVCSQLISRYGLSAASFPSNFEESGARLNLLLHQVAQQLSNGERLVIVIDALDEVEEAAPSGNSLLLPTILPKSVYFVLSSRHTAMIQVPEDNQERFDLNHHTDKTRQDVRLYLERALQRDGIKTWLERRQVSSEQWIQALVDSSKENFMYLRYVIPEMERGTYNTLELPRGLQAYYEDHWHRMGMRTKTPETRLKLRVIYVLCELRKPLSARAIAKYANDDKIKVSLYDVHTVLEEWREFLHEQSSEYGTLHSIYHASFQDFLRRKDVVAASEIDLREIVGLFTQSMLKDLGFHD